MWGRSVEKYKIETTVKENFLGTKLYQVKVTDVDTGKFAISRKWEYQKKNILHEAIDKLKFPHLR